MSENATRRRTVFRHPLAALGGAMVLAGGFAFVLLLILDLTSHQENPYRSLVTFVAAPAVLTLGVAVFLVSVWLQVRSARRRGEQVRFNLSIDPTDPAYLRSLWLFLAATAVLVLVVAFAGARAYEATESVGFCGQTCHEVMEPQDVTYHNSAHARVTCAQCHIGPGASFWVKSKVDGVRQVVATLRNTYSRPIATPVHSLRPAQETCEQCHWPMQFYGDKLVTRTYYRTDEQNTPWTVGLRVRIGGGNPRTGRLEGIHWHMLTAQRIEYIATDEKRQTIPWVRAISAAGDTVVYASEGEAAPDLDDPGVKIRSFDCIDCHNRPSHRFLPPAVAVNLALSTGRISRDLPYVRKIGVDLLNAAYPDRAKAHQMIATGLRDFYAGEYPELSESRAADIAAAISTLQQIYALNFFPEMKTDYRVRENNLSHFVNDGCFRCHDQSMVNAAGESISHECSACHLIVAQGATDGLDGLRTELSGLEFQHPEDIDEAWRESKCTECHTPDSGY